MNRFFSLLFVALCVPLALCSEIREIWSMGELAAEVEDAGPETLVVFDIDQVLVCPKNPAFHVYTIRKYAGIRRSTMRGLTPEQRHALINLTAVLEESQLVEEETPQLIERLGEQGVTLMALTACGSGTIPPAGNLPYLRVANLAEFGIDFSESFSEVDRILFTDLREFSGNFPVFEAGVLIANGILNPKGEVLVRFLQEVDFSPERVVFVDDARHNLESVELAMEKLGIPCLCLHYHGVEAYHGEDVTLEEFAERWGAYLAMVRGENSGELGAVVDGMGRDG